jgi:Cytochrome P460
VRRSVLAAAALLMCTAMGHAVASEQSGKRSAVKPQYSSDKLVRPEGYREWIYLSSGLGMNYNAAGGPERFTNVFVAPWAYREFVATGKWPEKSMFALEDRTSETKGSINRTGHFQTDLAGMAVEVKDSSQFPDQWAYFVFVGDATTAEAAPKAACWQCHNEHAAVENTFVQFYPTLKPIAQKFGTYRKEAENVTPSQ